MIKLKNIYKTFNQSTVHEFTALKDISLSIKKNELIILKGASGSGKSTLLAIIASLLKPTSGSVIVDNKQVAKLPDLHASKFRAFEIGFIFQSFNLFEYLSVKENVSVTLIPLGLKQDEIDKKVKRALRLANISHKQNAVARDLSGGEKQRVAIARALVNDPKIILCDEPTANLDKKNSLSFIEVIKDLKEKGFTIIIATHDSIFDSLQNVDKVVKIQNGEIK